MHFLYGASQTYAYPHSFHGAACRSSPELSRLRRMVCWLGGRSLLRVAAVVTLAAFRRGRRGSPGEDEPLPRSGRGQACAHPQRQQRARASCTLLRPLRTARDVRARQVLENFHVGRLFQICDEDDKDILDQLTSLQCDCCLECYLAARTHLGVTGMPSFDES